MTHDHKQDRIQPIDSVVDEALLEASAPVTPPPALRSKVLDQIHEQKEKAAPVTLRADEGWRSLVEGVKTKLLFVDKAAGTKSFLLKARAGSCMPGHAHHGWEECLVLEGEFTMGDLTLRSGDFHCVDTSVTHPEATTETGVLIYLRAAIQDYPGV